MTTGFRIPGLLLCAMAFVAGLQACTTTKAGPPPEAVQQEGTEASAARQEAAPRQKPENGAAASKSVKPPPVVTGDCQKTIDFYRKERRHRPHDQALMKEYVKSLKEMKTAADRASQNEDFVHAGKTYSVLLKNYPYYKDFAHDLSFDKAHLNGRVASCKTALYNRGFQEYRAGKLSEAISLWQGYLAIDPNNEDIRKALNTARAQQKNLHQP